MDILVTLIPVILFGGLFLLWINMLVHAIRSSLPNKLLWILLLIFTNVLGGIAYYGIIYRETKKPHEGLEKFFLATAIILVAIMLIATFAEPRQTASKTQEASFSKIIESNAAGQIKRIEVQGDELTVTLKDASKPTLHSRKPPGTSLQDQGISPEEVEIVVKPARE